MRSMLPLIIFLAIFLLLDFYVFKSLRLLTADWQNSGLRNLTRTLYLITALATYGFVLYAYFSFNRDVKDPQAYRLIYLAFGFVILMLVPKLVIASFHLLDDLSVLGRKLASWLASANETTGAENPTSKGMGRWKFISLIGWALAAIPFTGILYGIVRGRYDFRVLKSKIAFPHLPDWADGLKIVQLSDIHIGSFFNNYEPVLKGIKMVNELKPDLILFTGDIVNNQADELDGWVSHFSKLEAKMGKYSILGNHDYGDYVSWPSGEAKRNNLSQLKALHAEMGFRLLLNEWVPVDSGTGQNFELIGIENWGSGGFAKYGDLKKAMERTDPKKFQILLSHDPSHWDAQVLGQTAIDLTLAGHTHGMQFGVEIPGFIKWSPVQYRYPRWGGLYTESLQHIYVNRGFGYLGFPGRVGMPPEITLIELQKG